MSNFTQRIERLENTLSIKNKREELAALLAEQNQPNFWQNQQRAAEVGQKTAQLSTVINKFDEVAQLAAEADSDQTAAELIKEPLEQLEKESLLSGEYDNHQAILSIYAGAGGTDAQDWALMLFRMYQRFVERSGWKLELEDMTRGEEAGIKSVTAIIKGPMAYGLLKVEAGVHRLVRQSPFNAKALRQTSFAQTDVVPLIESTDEVDLDEKDIRVDVFRSSGHGGQSVNTTDSAVRLTHVPTGIVVSIQNERSQLQNKEKALAILKSRLLAIQVEQKRQETAKVRGEVAKNEWGSQIRSYVLHPYKLVKDHRTGVERSDVENVLDGDLTTFIEAALHYQEK